MVNKIKVRRNSVKVFSEIYWFLIKSCCCQATRPRWGGVEIGTIVHKAWIHSQCRLEFVTEGFRNRLTIVPLHVLLGRNQLATIDAFVLHVLLELFEIKQVSTPEKLNRILILSNFNLNGLRSMRSSSMRIPCLTLLV